MQGCFEALARARYVSTQSLDQLQLAGETTAEVETALAQSAQGLNDALEGGSRRPTTMKAYCDKAERFYRSAEEDGRDFALNSHEEMNRFRAFCITHVRQSQLAATTTEGYRSALLFIHLANGIQKKDSWTQCDEVAMLLKGLKKLAKERRPHHSRTGFS